MNTAPSDDDPLATHLRQTSALAGAGGRLPAADRVRARGVQRRRRRAADTVLAAAAAVVVAVTGTSAFLNAAPPDSPATVPSPAPSTPPVAPTPSTETPVTGETQVTLETPTGDPLTDGTHAVDLLFPDGRYLAPNVEGGVSVETTPDPAGVSPSWVVTPTGDGHVRLVTVTTTDGLPSCLHARDDGVVGLDRCDDTNPTQVFDPPTDPLTLTAQGWSVTVVDGDLTTTADPAQATTFTLVDRGPAG